MGDVTQNRRTALLAERSAAQAHKAAEASQNGQPSQAPQSTVGKAINAANTALKVYGDVMGAYGKVMGFTGELAEKAVVAVFSKLSFMQGLACLPASSQMDPVMGIDVHLVMIPPSPSPIPMPHPYIATVFNPKDFVACAVNTVTAMVPPPPPDSAGLQLASTVGNMAKGMIMGKLGLSATVKLGDATPRTHSGTKNKSIPHFPMGASFAPTPILKDAGEAFFGALLVLADGEPFTGLMHLNYDCWDIGIKALMRTGGDPDATHLYMPTGFIMAIPSHNVIVSPIPTPINPIKALTKILNIGLAKILHAIIDKLPPGLRGGLHAAVCHVTGHPVDVVSGMLFTDEEDFSLPGIIPFSWERTWYSDSSYRGPLGHGWYHNYDAAFIIDERNNQAVYRMNDGRGVAFQLPLPGKFTYDRKEKLFLRRNEEKKFYYIEDRDGLLYRFTDKAYTDPQTKITSHFLQSVSNRNGYAIRFEYDMQGHLMKIIDSVGRILQVENDEKKRIVNINAPHPSEPDRTFVIAHYDYDDAGNMLCHTDALGQKMLYEYNNHLLAKETWRNGHQWYFRYDGTSTGAKCIHTWGDHDIYNHKLTYNSGVTFVENSLGHITTYYHKNGLPYIKIDGNGAEWQYRYNNYNELEWETDPLGNQQNNSYNEWGNLVSSTDPGGGFTSIEYYNPKFPLLSTEAMDAGGGKWKWEYDAFGNLILSANPLGAKTIYEYEDGALVKVINPAEVVTLLSYDSQQNLSSIQSIDGKTAQYEYDKLGNCISITNYNGIKQIKTYDLKNRVKRIKDIDSNTIYFEYDGIDNIIYYHDDQKDIRFTYQGLWNLRTRTEAGATVVLKYDTEECLRKIINQHNEQYRFEVDAAGNVIEEVGFDNIIRQYERNAAGWITRINRPGKKFTKYTHDSCGRVTEVEFSDSKKEHYNYFPSGELMEAANESTTVKFERDLVNNIKKETVNDQWIVSEYNILNNRVRITSSAGANIDQYYTKAGDVRQMDANGWLAKFEHDQFGLEISRSLPGGINSQWQRDGIGRPLVHSISHASNNNLIVRKKKRYYWGVNDSLKQIKDEKGVILFEHSESGNLTKTIFQNREEQFRNSDAVGNLYKTLDQTDRIYAKSSQLKKANGWHYSYDDEGNLIEKKHVSGDIWRYEWNGAGRLIKVFRPDKTEVIFTYDAFGRRISKHYKNTVTKFVWDGNLPLHEWKENATTGEKLNDIQVEDNEIVTWLFDEGSFAPCGKLKGDKYYSIITDHAGVPCQMYKADGSLLWECEVDSYGKLTVEKGEAGSCPFRYQGQYEDQETGLYYNLLRYYAPDEGIYISQDPIGIKGCNSTLYAFVGDPLILIDVLGLSPTDLHHTIPREVYNPRDGSAPLIPKAVAEHPDVTGRPGNPNRWPVDRQKHREIHPDYNTQWKREINSLKRRGIKITVARILGIRDRLAKKFGILKYKPK
jgi:RHS repeat-associated protein